MGRPLTSAGAAAAAAELEAEDGGEAAIAAAIEAATAEEGGGSSSGAKAGAPAPADDPSLALPAPSRADWPAEMERLRLAVESPESADEERVKLLHEALVQRIEDTRGQEEGKAGATRRLEDAAKERERCRAEVQRALATKVKLEASCRDLQQQKSSIAKENQRIAEEEQSRHTELKDKFQQAIKDVQEKMDAELEVRQHFLRENEELRGKLLKFTETYEAQERQLAEQREAREREMEVAQQRLKEHESMCSESKVKTASLEKQNEVLRKSQSVLRDELQMILGKFDEFHEAVTGSNQRHGECKVEIDSLQSRLQDLEKENGDLRNSSQLSQLTQEQQVAQKQRDALERLCDNLQKENKKLQEQLQGLKRGRQAAAT
mmetsp:Transcript_98304/g.306727  ORF Transcript_98304/g.306727 Transcript_98304/m.306727 type:complete len:377 (-) Transcript_98304:143-1273(-)